METPLQPNDCRWKLSAWLIPMYFALTFYCVGIGLYSTIVTLHAWNLWGLSGFRTAGPASGNREFYEQFSGSPRVSVDLHYLDVCFPPCVPNDIECHSLLVSSERGTKVDGVGKPGSAVESRGCLPRAIRIPLQLKLDQVSSSEPVHERLRQLLYGESPLILLGLMTVSGCSGLLWRFEASASSKE